MISSSTISRAYIKSATALKLPFYYDKEWEGIEVYLSGKKYIFRGKTGTTPFNDGSTQDLTSNKFAVNYLLTKIGIPMPQMAAISESEHLVNNQWILPDNLPAYPIVAKPVLDHGCGKDVLCNIQDKETLLEYLNLHKKKHTHFCIEHFEPNLTSYRVVVFFNKVVAVSRRDPAAVIGDGLHNIKELMDLQNEVRKKNTEVTLGDLTADKECEVKLKELNLSLDYIPKPEEVVTICYACNSGRGGTMTSLGRSICPENSDLVLRAAKTLNLNLVGFDVLCEDILRPIHTSRGFIIEANANPDITVNEYTFAGVNVPLSRIILKKLIYRHPINYAWSRIQKITTGSRLALQYSCFFTLLLIAVKLTHHSSILV